MRVPDRISLDPSSLSRMNIPLDSPEDGNMKVPERIVMCGTQNQSSPLMVFNRRGDDLIDNLDPVPLQHALEPLPTSLVLNEVNYPDLERLNIEKRDVEVLSSPPTDKSQNKNPTEPSSPLHLPTISNVKCDSPTTPSLSSSSLSSQLNQTKKSTYESQSILHDTRRIRLLENRVNEIELELSRRQFIDKIFYITFGGYFVLKFLRILFF
uniref:SJCHGC03988 protein n=1 Tax=Schistosoma japonicum TaxID=6182 RepID=Q5DCE4_SCHJA|nr:SJCHGC03988 protein [Schistosoma japonicum]